MNEQRFEHLSNEVTFQASRSSGPGGQHVNKVNSRVELRLNIDESLVLTEREKGILKSKLGNRISNTGIFSLAVQDDRSQLKNKILALSRFRQILEAALKPRKKRKNTKPTRSSIEKRLKMKKRRGEKKKLRRM